MPDDNSPVNRAEFRAELRASLDDAVELIISEIRALEDRTIERERALETKLLSAFYDWARTNQTLLAQARADHAEHQATTRTSEARFTALEWRMLRIEERLNLEPPPPQ